MILSVRYDELTKIIKDKTAYEIDIEYISNDTIKISKNVMWDSAKVGLRVKILGFSGSTLRIKASSDTLTTILSWLPDHNFNKFVKMESGIVSVSLKDIEQLKSSLKFMSPLAIHLNQDSLDLEVTLN